MFSIQNNDRLINFLNSVPSSIISKNKLLQTDFSDKTTSFPVNNIDTYLFCNGVGITVSLPSPSLNLSRNLIFSNRSANQVLSNLNIQYIDSTTGTILTTTTLLPSTTGSWCQIVSDGNNWIMISKQLSGTPFTFTINTNNTSVGSSNSNQFTLPFVSTGKYDCLIDWGDGLKSRVTNYNQSDITHTYSSAGTKTISITGLCNGFRFNNSSDRLKLTNISQWGSDFRLGRTEGGYFYGCVNLTVSAVDTLNLKGTTSLNNCFNGCSIFNYDVSGWNTSAVTDMSFMFANAIAFNNGDAGGVSTKPLNWNTSSVTNMSYMFSSAYIFNQTVTYDSINNYWDTSKVTLMFGLFDRAYAFNNGQASGLSGAPLNWNTSAVTDINGMFKNTIAFNQPVGNFDTSNVTNMNGVFNAFAVTPSFNQPLNWNTSKVTNMVNMFYNSKFNQNISYDPINNYWNTSQVTDMSLMFGAARFFNNGQTSGLSGAPLNWDTSSVTNMSNCLILQLLLINQLELGMLVKLQIWVICLLQQLLLNKIYLIGYLPLALL